MSVRKCLFFQDLEGLTEVFGRMSAGISGLKLPLWAEFSFLIFSVAGSFGLVATTYETLAFAMCPVTRRASKWQNLRTPDSGSLGCDPAPTSYRGPFGPEYPGGCPRERPRERGCPRECPTGCPRNPKKCQRRALYGPIPVKTETFRELWGPLVHTFSCGNSYGPMVLKVLQKFPPTLALVHGWLFPEVSRVFPECHKEMLGPEGPESLPVAGRWDRKVWADMAFEFASRRRCSSNLQSEVP